MKINHVAIVVMLLVTVSLISAFVPPALAIDPGAETPGATITGLILDANGNSVSNATVRLFLDGQLFDVPRNPQQSGNGTGQYGPIGRYQFLRLPRGEYLISAEIRDAAGNAHGTNLSVTVNANTVTADLVLPDLVIAMPAAPSPTPSPLPSASPAPAGTSVFGVVLAIALAGIFVFLIVNQEK